jgi:hypothetical protein
VLGQRRNTSVPEAITVPFPPNGQVGTGVEDVVTVVELDALDVTVVDVEFNNAVDRGVVGVLDEDINGVVIRELEELVDIDDMPVVEVAFVCDKVAIAVDND